MNDNVSLAWGNMNFVSKDVITITIDINIYKQNEYSVFYVYVYACLF